MNGWWVAEAWEISPVLLVSWVLWVIGSIVLHELAHGWAAIRCGDRTPLESGHMTWNPLVHMGQTSLLMFAVVGIAWGAMPVDPSRFRGRYDGAIVAAAGPAMNLFLATFCLIALCLWIAAAGGYWSGGDGVGEPLFQNMQTFLRIGLVLNIVLMLFNLIPVPPLDGSRILASLWPSYERLWQGEQAQWMALAAFIGVFFFAGDFVFGAGFAAAGWATDAVLSVIAPAAV